jgi:hypothetical protein
MGQENVRHQPGKVDKHKQLDQKSRASTQPANPTTHHAIPRLESCMDRIQQALVKTYINNIQAAFIESSMNNVHRAFSGRSKIAVRCMPRRKRL